MILYWITCWTILTYSLVFCDLIMKLPFQIIHERDTIVGEKKTLRKTSDWQSNTISASFKLSWFHWQLLMGVTTGQTSGRQDLGKKYPFPSLATTGLVDALRHGMGEGLYHCFTLTASALHPPRCLWMEWWSIILARSEKFRLLEIHQGPAAGDNFLHCWKVSVGGYTGFGLSFKSNRYWAWLLLSAADE